MSLCEVHRYRQGGRKECEGCGEIGEIGRNPIEKQKRQVPDVGACHYSFPANDYSTAMSSLPIL